MEAGTSQRAHSTMSLSMQPSRVTSTSIIRSQSFAGVNSNCEKIRLQPAFHTPTVSRKSGSRIRRMFSISHKSPPKVPKPDRVDEVYDALKKGLRAYLEVHQMELDKLTTQIRESKRNSRLGFLYDLDKQVKSIERFIRRLEFHTSKIDELYEAYCIQRRLRDGAHNMVRAYTASPTSKEARESLSEAGKGYKEYTENMCVLENELECQLGEFHIKMKGLAGFARLCAGDQYEIFMKYGRQRWKLKGRIEVNGKQIWDSEGMVFLPLITEFLSIKVTELKSLANHVVVGSVSCETKDLFGALPQVVAVDINDLATIKLSLEVNWNPFDKEEQSSAASTVNKASSVNKRFSTYSPSPPDTPSLREQAFYNMLRRQDDLENGATWSISSESSDDSSSPQLSGSGRHAPKNIVQPEVQASPPDIEISFSQREESKNTRAETVTQKEETDEQRVQKNVSVKEYMANGHVPYSRSLSHISEVSFDASVSEFQALDGPQITLTLDTGVSEVADAVLSCCKEDADLSITVRSHCAQELENATLNTKTKIGLEQEIVHSGQPLSLEMTIHEFAAKVEDPEVVVDEHVETDQQQSRIQAFPISFSYLDIVLEEGESPIIEVITSEITKVKPVDTGLDEAINSLSSSLDDYRGQFPELQTLEHGVKHLEKILMQRQGVFRSRASSISLNVENALESFNFLNTTSDMEDSECSDEERGQNDRSLSSEHLPVEVVEQSRPTMEDPRVCCTSEGISDPLSTGSEHLDRALVMHLNNCNRLLLQLGTFGPLRCCELYALDKLMREAQILEIICTLTETKSGKANSAEEVPAFPKDASLLSVCETVMFSMISAAMILLWDTKKNIVQFSSPKEEVLTFWNQCVQASDVFVCSVEMFLKALSMRYSEQVNSQQQGLADAVFVRLGEDILNQKLPMRSRTTYSDRMTIFQYWSHFESITITTLDGLILQLAKEVLFVQNLNSDDQNEVLKALKRIPESCVQKEGFKTLSLLLTNGNSRVITAVSSFLRTFSEQQDFRERALVCFLEQLEDEDVHMRVSGCAALGCLKAKESINQLVYLCQTDKDEVKEAAKHSLMLFGEDGKVAYRHLEETMGSLPQIFAPGAMASTAF